MNRFTRALLGSSCLTALSAGWAQAGTIVVPEFPDTAAAALAAGSGAANADATGASLVTGSIERFFITIPGASGGSTASGADFADWFRLTLAPGQQLGFSLAVTPVNAAGSGAPLADDAVVTPDGSSAPAGSGSGGGTGSLPPPTGTPDPIFSQFTLEVLDGTFAPLSFVSGDGGTDVLHGLLTAPVGGTVLFGLRDYLISDHDGLAYTLSLSYGDVPEIIGPPPTSSIPAPSGLAVVAAGAAAGGLGFLRRRKKKR